MKKPFEGSGAEELVRLLGQDEVPPSIEICRNHISDFVGHLHPRPSWADDFLEQVDAIGVTRDLLEIRAWQMLARVVELPSERLVCVGDELELLAPQRAALFALLSAPVPDWQWLASLSPPVADSVSAAMQRLRQGHLPEESLFARAMHRLALRQARSRPLGFAHLVLEEARTSTGDPDDALHELLEIEPLVSDPLLEHEHPPPLVQALHARWHLYVARALAESGRLFEQEYHMKSFSRLARLATGDLDLVASGFEALAEHSLEMGDSGQAISRLSMALSCVPVEARELDERRNEIYLRLQRLTDAESSKVGNPPC